MALLLLLAACHSGEKEPEVVVSVKAAKAERGAIANDITAVATLAAAREATITPKISAQIRQMDLVSNRAVRAGDVIALLESKDVGAQRAEAEAALTEAEATARSTTSGSVPLTNAQDVKAVHDAQANLDNAKKTLERRQKLFEQGGISKKDLEASELAVTTAGDDLRLAESSAKLHHGVTNPADVTVAGARARQARERLANLDAQLGYSVIRAPFNGVVTEQFQFQGDFANPGQKLVTIADPSTLIAKMQLSAELASTLKQGDAATVFPDEAPDQSFAGTISMIGRGADPQSRSVAVWVMVPNPRGVLRPNGIARVVIGAQKTNDAVMVPSSAVTLDATNAKSGTVMIVDAQSIAHEVHVTIGARSGAKTQITSGLKGGETVVIEGNYGLPDGTKVAQ
ncbi:MAG TPA: efflux RND transporter periplasmic adaptor subunit [Thermoanaerobaculia bacterium]|nr:efflux RND transporter periplasmic adaptor subunit [Thermoanaerobaculia bacterium]